MMKAKGNIEKIDKYAKMVIQDLKAREKLVVEEDLLLLLFQGYISNPDMCLHTCYQCKKDAFEDGERMSDRTLN